MSADVEPLVTLKDTSEPMLQPSNADRKTVVVRVPRKYRFLVKAFVCWLKVYPDKNLLWNSETTLEDLYGDDDRAATSPQFIKNVGEGMSSVLSALKRSEAKAIASQLGEESAAVQKSLGIVR